MTDINLKDFDKNNWDEFVHLRALKDVIDQENAINNEQNQQITQNTNDIATAKQEAEDAKQTADEASQNAASAGQLANMAMQSATQANAKAQNAETIAGKAQDTATQLGSQVSQLDSEVIKKYSDANNFATNQIVKVNNESLTSPGEGRFDDYYVLLANGEVIERIEISLSASFTTSLTSSSVIQLELSTALKDLGWQDCHVIISGQKNQVEFVIGAQFNNNGIRINFNDMQSRINALTGPYKIQIWSYVTIHQ